MTACLYYREPGRCGSSTPTGSKSRNSTNRMTRCRNVIIEKHWRTVIPRAAVDIFWDARHKYDRPEEVPPVIATDQYYLHHIYSNGLFLLAVVIEEGRSRFRQNKSIHIPQQYTNVFTKAPPSSVLHFLHRVVELLTDYFGSVSEGVIKENFVIVYEVQTTRQRPFALF